MRYEYKVVSSDWDNGPLYHSLREAKTGLAGQTERTAKAHRDNLARGFDYPDPEPYVIVRRRRAAVGEKQVSLSVGFGISESQLSLIVNRKTWKHLAEEQP